MHTMRHSQRIGLELAKAARAGLRAGWATGRTARPAVRAGARWYSAPGTQTVKLTAESYPQLERDTRFARVTAEDMAAFEAMLGAGQVVTGADAEGYNIDTMRKYKGQASVVLRPRTTEEVAAIMRHCHARRLAVVPQGGNTGLVGGSVPVFDEIVVSLALMNSVRAFDPVSGVLEVDAGCVLETADQYVAEHGYIFPLDLGAKGSCHIGGNVATNAGGLRLLRYGSLHGTVLGVEAVLADGTVVNGMSRLRKDNTGYDLKQLFIGSEGTLGVITGVAVLCPRRSAVVNVAFFGLESYEKVQQAFVRAKGELQEILSAFEFMDQEAVEHVGKMSGHLSPLDDKHRFYVLVETSGSNREHDEDKLQTYLEGLMENDVIADGVLAQDETQLRSLWNLREGIPESLAKSGGVYKYDVSIPLNELYQLVDDTRTHLAEQGFPTATEGSPVVNVVGYGHLGDGNLHLNVAVNRYNKAVEAALEPWVYEWIQKRSGSISAEHGVGFAKKNYLHYSKDQGMIDLMRQLKVAYDPQGILNPYKYI
ncbi:FAD linked oxidase [Dipodascopsis tothii]|uniref:FAD linked oxidase n=1 Tax=Dipodascopsis tothii TaxID=44089 RepID=UPI0034CD72DA